MCEPWCRLPAEVAALTDFQIAYVLAAQARRIDRLGHGRDGTGAGTGGGADTSPPRLDRDYAVDYLTTQHGYTRAAAEAAVDRAARGG
jgi:hypothetical protein